MSFVAMVNFFFKAQLLQGQNTANTQHHFLFQAVFPVAAVKLVSNGTIEFAVMFIVGIEQIKGDTAYGNFPHVGVNRTSGIRHLHHQRLVVGIFYLFDRQ